MISEQSFSKRKQSSAMESSSVQKTALIFDPRTPCTHSKANSAGKVENRLEGVLVWGK